MGPKQVQNLAKQVSLDLKAQANPLVCYSALWTLRLRSWACSSARQGSHPCGSTSWPYYHSFK